MSSNRTRSRGRVTSANKYKFKKVSSPLRNPLEYNFMGMPADNLKAHASKSRSPPRHDERYLKQRMDINEDQIINLERKNMQLRKSLERQREAKDMEFARKMNEKWDKQFFSMEQDKLSLLQKINSTLVELNTLNQQVEHLQKKYEDNAQHSFALQRQIDAAHQESSNECQHLKDQLERQKHENNGMTNELKSQKRHLEDLQLQLAQKEAIISDCQRELQSLSVRLDECHEAMKQLQTDYEIVLGEIDATKKEIDSLMLNQPHHRENILDLEKAIESIYYQKQNLVNEIGALKHKHDQFEMMLHQDQRDALYRQRRHQRVLSSQILGKLMVEIFRVRRQRAFDEIGNYASFDATFNSSTTKICKAFAQICRVSQRKYLNRWYINTLKPAATIDRGNAIHSQIASTLKEQQDYSNWKQARLQEERTHSDHFEGAKLIKLKILRISRDELSRRFKYWRSLCHHNQYREQIIKETLLRGFMKKQNQAFSLWKQSTQEVKETLRLQSLITQVSSQQYLQRIFSAWKEVRFETSNAKSNRLAHVFKAWKDAIKNNKDLKKKAIAVLRIDMSRDTGLLQRVFNALRVSKQTQMFEMTFEEVEAERPRREMLEKEVEKTESGNTVDRTQKSLNTIADCMGRQFYSYFRHWLQVTKFHNYVLHKKFKMKVLNLYLDKLRKGFNHWKHAKAHKNKQEVTMQIEEANEEFKELQTNVIQMEKEIKQKSSDREVQREHQMDRVIRHTLLRFVKNRFLHWKYLEQNLQTKEQGASSIINRLRKRILRKAFDMYRDSLREQDKNAFAQKRCDYFIKTHNDRLKQRCYDAWAQYQHGFELAKNACKRMLCRGDQGRERRAFLKWVEHCKSEKEELRKGVKESLDKVVKEQNNEIGDLSNAVEEQKEGQGEIMNQLTRQSRKILAYQFARFFFNKQSHAFYQWKAMSNYQHQSERILRNCFYKYRKNQLLRLKQVWEKLKNDQIIQEHNEILQQKEAQYADLEFQDQKGAKDNTEQENDLKDFINSTADESVFYQKRANKAIQLISERASDNHYMSKKRYILQQWRMYTRNTKMACRSISSAMSHFLLNCGFQGIKDQSKQKSHQTEKEIHLRKFWEKFTSRSLQSAFNRWRSSNYQQVISMIEDTEINDANTRGNFTSKLEQIRNHNITRAENQIEKLRRRNLLRGWHNAAKYMGMIRRRQESQRENNDVFGIVWALRRWNSRAQRTKEVRNRQGRLRVYMGRGLLKDYFEAWRQHHQSTKALCQRLGNLATTSNHGSLLDAFKCILNFANSKVASEDQRKKDSSLALHLQMERLMKQRLKSAWDDLKIRGDIWHYQNNVKRRALLNCANRSIRAYFLKWKRQFEKQVEAEEIYEEGPSRQREREQGQTVGNLKQILMEEGFTEEQIQDMIKSGEERDKQLINKVVQRNKHYNIDKYCMPKYFDRWIQFVKLRKLYKYWLERTNNMTNHETIDISQAFYRWKQYIGSREANLQAMSREELEDFLINNQRKLNNLDEEAYENDVAIEQLENQRDILVENLYGSQKLACAYIRSQNDLARQKALLRWFRNQSNGNREEHEEALRENMQNIIEKRSDLKNLQLENDSLEDENEEMRQAALEGIEMAKTVNELNKERDSLSVDLADKAAMIKKLLDDNTNLTQKLKNAQNEAQNLLRMSQASGFTPGMTAH